MKIAVITCYFDPDYVRARTLRAGLESLPGIETIIVKNNHKSLLRYPEVLTKTFWARVRHKPDFYLITFRGQEILPFVLAIASPKKVIFDEFIVPLAWATQEKRRFSLTTLLKNLLARLSAPFYKRWLNASRVILTDTNVHAEISSKVSGVDLGKYKVVPVGADESLFFPDIKKNNSPLKFRVFFYGGMHPLHGISYILNAAEMLKDHKTIEFFIVGGDKSSLSAINASKEKGANIRYKKRLNFEDIPTTIKESSLCLGGPFGGTPQAMQVVTGKTYQFLACSAPVIVGRSEATHVFEDRVNSIVVPQKNARAISDAILWANNHPFELERIAAAGHRLYVKNFSNAVISEDLSNILKELT